MTPCRRSTVGLRTDGGTWYPWVYAAGDDLRDEGQALYAEQQPQPPAGADQPVGDFVDGLARRANGAHGGRNVAARRRRRKEPRQSPDCAERAR